MGIFGVFLELFNEVTPKLWKVELTALSIT